MTAAAFVLSLSALVAAQRWYGEQSRRPALDEVRRWDGVTSAWLGPAVSPTVREALWVALQPTADDSLPSRVRRLRELVSAGQLGRDVGEVVLVDARDARLRDALYRVRLAVQEGISTGRFTDMADAVETVGARYGLDRVRTYVEPDAVYVVLGRGDQYLYDVVVRQAPGSSVPVAGQGSTFFGSTVPVYSVGRDEAAPVGLGPGAGGELPRVR